MPLVETVLEDARWQAVAIEPLAERAAAATLRALALDPAAFAISLLACDDTRIAALNADFRGKAAPTNVLSWPGEARAASGDGARPADPIGDARDPEELGDIAIAYDTCAQEAAAQNKPMAEHVTHLIVHATLHLLGYDHIRDADAALMEAQEIAILAEMGLSDPYR